MGLSRFLVLALTAATLASPGSAHATAWTVDGRIDDWTGVSTMLGGTAQYSAGEYVYQDHIYDDYGANTNQRAPNRSAIGSQGMRGDYRYPTDAERYAGNAADIFQIRFALDDDMVRVLVVLNALREPDTTVVGIAIHGSGKFSLGVWPHAAGMWSPGADVVLTLWGNGGDLTNTVTGESRAVSAAVDVETNAIEAAFPRAELPYDVWTVWAASGLWDGHAWMPVPEQPPTETSPGYGSASVEPRAFNVAFRFAENGAYMENQQADALASRSFARFSTRVDLRKLASKADEPYVIQTGRAYAAIYRGSFTIPPLHEGAAIDGVPGRFPGLAGQLSQTFDFYGPYQPYVVYLPESYKDETRLPLALVLHGHGGSHVSFVTQPGFVRDFAENPPTIVVSPLARGSSFYADYGERDVFDVLADVERRFVYDHDRRYIAGYSMGGYGTYRLATLYPDMFAGAVSWAGYTGEFVGAYLTFGGTRGKATIGDPVDFLENLLHTPLAHLAGTNDEILPITGQYAAPRRLEQLGYRHRFDLYPGYEHLTFALVDDWKQARAWLGSRSIEPSPRRVVYKFSGALTDPALPAGVGVPHGNAWWVSDLAVRDAPDDVFSYGSIDAESDAIADDAHTTRMTLDAAGSPTPNVQKGTAWDDGAPLPIANRLRVTLTNIASAAVDAAEAQLQPGGLEIDVTTDGPATILIRGDFAGLEIDASGAEAKIGAAGLELTLPQSGRYVVVVSR